MSRMPIRLAPFLLSILAAACATTPDFVLSDHQSKVPLDDVAADLARADVVVLGEEHDSVPAHRAHFAIVQELHERRPDLAISLEMFERDVQGAVIQYLAGDIGEDEFLARSRPWREYERDYRPLIEFAKQNRLDVIAANAPRKLASQVSRMGLASVQGSPDVARESTAPEDDYWRAFQQAMQEHMGAGSPDEMKRKYVSQCLKDDTMAESIADYLQRAAKEGRHPLVVHVTGKFHSDYRRGTVARLQQRMPELDIRVLSVETTTDPGLAIYSTSPQLADYVVLVPESPKETREGGAAAAAPRQPAQPAQPSPHAQPGQPSPHARPDAAAGGTDDVGAGNPIAPGRPALGVRPDYGFAGEGLRLEDVVAGGPADAAGLEPGDVLTKIGREPIGDMQGYMLLLSSLTPGAEIEVTLLRDGKELQKKVTVGTR